MPRMVLGLGGTIGVMQLRLPSPEILLLGQLARGAQCFHHGRIGGPLIEEGDVIGEMGLIEREPRNADVIATSPMRVIKLTHWEIRRMSEDTIERIKEIVKKREAAGVADPGFSPDE